MYFARHPDDLRLGVCRQVLLELPETSSRAVPKPAKPTWPSVDFSCVSWHLHQCGVWDPKSKFCWVGHLCSALAVHDSMTALKTKAHRSRNTKKTPRFARLNEALTSTLQVASWTKCPVSMQSWTLLHCAFSPDVVGVIGAGLPPGLRPCCQFPNKSNINQVELVRISKGLEQMIRAKRPSYQ